MLIEHCYLRDYRKKKPTKKKDHMSYVKKKGETNKILSCLLIYPSSRLRSLSHCPSSYKSTLSHQVSYRRARQTNTKRKQKQRNNEAVRIVPLLHIEVKPPIAVTRVPSALSQVAPRPFPFSYNQKTLTPIPSDKYCLSLFPSHLPSLIVQADTHSPPIILPCVYLSLFLLHSSA